VQSAAEWLTAIGTVGATIAAVALGLGLREWVFRPRLRVRFSASRISDQVVMGILGGGLAAYVRPGIANEGRAAANRVRVSLLELEQWDRENEGWRRVRPEMDAGTFIWSNRPGEPALDIPPKSERPLDFFAIIRDLQEQGDMPMELQLGVRPANRSDRLPPGSWRTKIEVSADNAPRRRLICRFVLTGPGLGSNRMDLAFGRRWR
jgi:hypothetical protein